MKTTSQRMAQISTHFFAKLNARIEALQAGGVDVIRLDEGSPDMPPAAFIIEALKRSASLSNRHGYQPHRGSGDLRAAWAEMYSREYQVELDPDREVIPLLGSKEGIFHLSLTFVEQGDLVLVPDPGYITYKRGAQFAGGEAYAIPLSLERNYLPDLEAIPIEVLRRAKLMWLNYPSNPTAAVASLEFFERAVAFARKHDLWLCHDAAYTQVTFNGRHAPSVLQIPGATDVAIEFNTLSKSHNMAGWRVAAVLGNEDALSALYNLKTNADSSHFLPIMEAAIVAMRGDQSWLQERNEIYRQRRDLIIEALDNMGIKARVSGASLYVWSPIPEGWGSVDFVTASLEEAGVSIAPGVIFGTGGEGYMRIALTTSLERTRLAMNRLSDWIKK